MGRRGWFLLRWFDVCFVVMIESDPFAALSGCWVEVRSGWRCFCLTLQATSACCREH
jgi:hypothetical protein